MIIRDATEADLPGILAIYNDAVLHTAAIWNETIVDLDNRRQWLADRRRSGYPVLVAIAEGPTDAEAGAVLGYASFGDWCAWDGYRHTVEHSIYIRADRRGQGLAKPLMMSLIERARRLGKHVMIAGIEGENAVSIGLHRALGFDEIGQARQVGAKFGRWLDLVFMQLVLDAALQPAA